MRADDDAKVAGAAMWVGGMVGGEGDGDIRSNSPSGVFPNRSSSTPNLSPSVVVAEGPSPGANVLPAISAAAEK